MYVILERKIRVRSIKFLCMVKISTYPYKDFYGGFLGIPNDLVLTIFQLFLLNCCFLFGTFIDCVCGNKSTSTKHNE